MNKIQGVLHWFNPIKKQPGSLGFIANRLAGLGLTLYLLMHLLMLGKLSQGEKAYMDFITLAKTPLILAGELLVILACLLHGLNGIRIVLNSLGIGLGQQKILLIIFMVISAAGTVYFGIRMFGE
jgi:succinate dehydrogenase / fumarate reductase cytochrome b subunit